MYNLQKANLTNTEGYKDRVAPYEFTSSFDVFTRDLSIRLSTPKNMIPFGGVFSMNRVITYADELTDFSLNYLIMSLKKQMDEAISKMDLPNSIKEPIENASEEN